MLGAHSNVPLRVVSRGRGHDNEGQELALLRLLAAGAHGRGVAITALRGLQRQETRKVWLLAARSGVKERGRGEYPVSDSLAEMRANVCYEAVGCPLEQHNQY